MIRRQIFESYRNCGNTPDQKNETESNPKNATVEDFLVLAKCLDDVKIYLSTSQNYMNTSKKTIDNLKSNIIQAEADISTAEECMHESQKKIQHLSVELQSLFNKIFYQNLDTVAGEAEKTGDSHEYSTVVTIDEADDYVTPVLQKYADESNINLESYNLSYEEFDDHLLVILHPKNSENSNLPVEVSNSPNSSFQLQTSSKSLNYDMQRYILDENALRKKQLGNLYKRMDSVKDGRVTNDIALYSEACAADNGVQMSDSYNKSRSQSECIIPKSQFTEGKSSQLCTMREIDDAFLRTVDQNSRYSSLSASNFPVNVCNFGSSNELPRNTESSSYAPLINLSEPKESQSNDQMRNIVKQTALEIYSSDSSESECEIQVRKGNENESNKLFNDKPDSPCTKLLQLSLSSSDSDSEWLKNIQEQIRRNKMKKGVLTGEPEEKEKANQDLQLIHLEEVTDSKESEKRMKMQKNKSKGKVPKNKIPHRKSKSQCLESRPSSDNAAEVHDLVLKGFFQNYLNIHGSENAEMPLSTNEFPEGSAISDCNSNLPKCISEKRKPFNEPSDDQRLLEDYINSDPGVKEDKYIPCPSTSCTFNNGNKSGNCFEARNPKDKDAIRLKHPFGLTERCFSDEMVSSSKAHNLFKPSFNTPQYDSRRRAFTNVEFPKTMNKTYRMASEIDMPRRPLNPVPGKQRGQFVRHRVPVSSENSVDYALILSSRNFDKPTRDNESKNSGKDRSFSQGFAEEIYIPEQKANFNCENVLNVEKSPNKDTNTMPLHSQLDTSSCIDPVNEDTVSSAYVDTSGSMSICIPGESSSDPDTSPERNNFLNQRKLLSKTDSLESFVTVFDSVSDMGRCNLREDSSGNDRFEKMKPAMLPYKEASAHLDSSRSSSEFPFIPHPKLKPQKTHLISSPKPDYSP